MLRRIREATGAAVTTEDFVDQHISPLSLGRASEA
jgi:hypothetical protein